MATERVTIEVESNIGEDGPLTVLDTMHQFIDAFELLSAAIAQEPGGDKVRWRLESLSKNSPARATAVAYSADPTIIVAPLVHSGKRRFSHGIEALVAGEVAPWLRSHSRAAKELLRRNLNGVGRTVFDLEDDAPRTILVERFARSGLEALERADAPERDRSRSEFGTIDAHVAEAKTYNGKPAIYVRERLSGRVIPCVLSDQLAERAGSTHSWTDAWNGKRVRIKGELFYDRAGLLNRISARDLSDVEPASVSLRELRDIDLLEGRDPVEHVRRLWDDDDD
jgi:hypothetical protein